MATVRVFPEYEIHAASLTNPVVCYNMQEVEAYVAQNLTTESSVLIKKVIRTVSVETVYPTVSPWPESKTKTSLALTQETRIRAQKTP